MYPTTKHMDFMKKFIESAMEKERNMAPFVLGYVINRGGPYGFDTKSVVYPLEEIPNSSMWYVLADCIGGGTHWYIYHASDFIKDKQQGVEILNRLNRIKARR